jgi:hypothetical protein
VYPSRSTTTGTGASNLQELGFVYVGLLGPLIAGGIVAAAVLYSKNVVIGSRILRGHLPRIRRLLYRSLLSLAYSKFFRYLFRIPIYDPQCGFKMFRREVIPHLFNEIGTDGFAFDSEVIVKATSLNYRVKEVPINWRHGKFSTLNIIHEIASMGSDILLV